MWANGFWPAPEWNPPPLAVKGSEASLKVPGVQVQVRASSAWGLLSPQIPQPADLAGSPPLQSGEDVGLAPVTLPSCPPQLVWLWSAGKDTSPSRILSDWSWAGIPSGVLGYS